MFRLIKLAAYALLGYALYEFYLGLTGEQHGTSRQRAGGDSRRQSFGSAGEGDSVRTEDSNGGSASHLVGRGVIR